MRHKLARLALAVGVIALGTAASQATTPENLRNATIKPATLNGTLSETVSAIASKADDDEWIGYSVEPRPGIQVCGGTWHNGRSRADLSEDEDGMSTSNFDEEEDGFAVERDLAVLLRVGNGRIDRIRVFTDDCPVKASGVVVHWLGNIPSNESIDYLSKLLSTEPANKRERERLHSRACAALATHADPSVVTAMERAVEKQTNDQLRGEIVFWIGESGSPECVPMLLRLLDDDPSEHVREQTVFALSCNDSKEALDALIVSAKQHDDRDVRSKALFWLAQKAGERAKETLRDAAIDDPDQYVKEQAVFALSQLPEDEGVPMLIDVARNNPNAKVREQAIFWLGQSEDPRALTFFEEILSR